MHSCSYVEEYLCLRFNPVQQSTVAERIVAARIRTIITTATFNTRTDILINIIPVFYRPRRIHMLDTSIVRCNCLVSWSDTKALLTSHNTQQALPASVRGIGNSVVGVVFSNIFGPIAEIY